MNDDVNLLSDELHELADGIGPTSSTAARDRARRSIARRARNRRAAVGGAGAVVIIVATVFFAVDRTHDDTARPIGTTSHSGVTSTPSTAGAPTTTSRTPATMLPIFPRNGIYNLGPSVELIVDAPSSYTRTLPWGRGHGQVAYSVPQGEGASGGPTGFSADSAGNLVLLDHSNARLVQLTSDTAGTIAIDLASPAVTASVFDAQGRAIVALYNDIAVYGPDGVRQATFAGPGPGGGEITRLIVVGHSVYSVADDNSLNPELRDEGSGYVRSHESTLEPDAVVTKVLPGRHMVEFTIAGSQQTYRIAGTDAVNIRNVPAARLLPDGSFAFVLGFDEGTSEPDHVATYAVGRISPTGGLQLRSVRVAAGYLVNGPQFEINDDGLAVMSSTTTGGVTVAYYPFT